MHRTIRTAAAMGCLAAAAFVANPAAAHGSTVPEAFRGEWNMDRAQCGTGLNDSVLRIGAQHIAWYETQGPVRAAVQFGRELALVAQVPGERRGEPALQTAHFALSANGRELTDLADSHRLVRHRCPAARRR